VQQVLKKVCTILRCEPECDFFATHINTQSKVLGSLHPGPHYCEWVDSLSQPWHQPRRMYYAFPPHRLIKQTVAKAELEKTTMLLIAPVWPSTPMYQIAQMLYNVQTMQDTHYNLKDSLEKTVDNATSPLTKLNPKFMLAAYLASGGNASKVKATHQKWLSKRANKPWVAKNCLLYRSGRNGTFCAEIW
jgi:hypothetical protein